MKKMLCMLMALMLACALPLGAFAEEAEMDVELEGLVLEVVEGGFLMDDVQLGEVMINTSEQTIWDGIYADGAAEIEAGQYVLVIFDGKTTRSLPPQAHGDKVGCYVLSGTVSEVYEDSFLLTDEAIFGEVIVHTAESLSHVYAGMPVTVYYDGVMAMSLPGQAGARHIVVPQLSGMVSEWTEEGFLLTGEDEQVYEVILAEETIVGLMSEEIVEEAIAEDADAAEIEETADEQAEEGSEDAEAEEANASEETEAELPTLEWGDGDFVTVYFDGEITEGEDEDSLSKLTALEIVVQR